MTIKGPEWARGCKDCQFGLVAAPEIIGALSLYEQRAVEAEEGMIEFCTCRAGHMYRQCLRKIYNNTSLDARHKIREYIEAAQTPPTIHWQEEAEPQP